MLVAKSRVFYAASLLMLGGLSIFTMLHPVAKGGKHSEVLEDKLLKTEEGWVVEFDVTNREGKEQNYTICCSINGEQPYEEGFRLQDGQIFTFIHRIDVRELSSEESKAYFAVYKEGNAAPLEEIVYHLE